MKMRFGFAATLLAVLIAAPVLIRAQVTIAPKGGAVDTFTVKVGSATAATVSLRWVADYPAQSMKKACQDLMYRGLIVKAAWDFAQIDPGPGVTVAVYDEIRQVERRGYPAHPLATVQGEGFQVTVHWMTPSKLKALGYCHDEGLYSWWNMSVSGPDMKRVGLLLDVVTDSGREWWILEKCGEAPTTLRKVETPGTAADLECPPGK